GDQHVDADMVQDGKAFFLLRRDAVEKPARAEAENQAEGENGNADPFAGLAPRAPPQQPTSRHCQQHPGAVRPGAEWLSAIGPVHFRAPFRRTGLTCTVASSKQL